MTNALGITKERAEYMQKKAHEYSLQILDGLAKSSINHDEFENDDNLKAFIQALANLVPNSILHNLTGEDLTALEFNHRANHIAVDYGFYWLVATPEAEEQVHDTNE
jgi:hypothetical protein